jgi:hypothetical protein
MSKLFRLHRTSLLLPSVKTVFDGIGWTWDMETSGISNFDLFAELVRGIE